MDFYTVTIPPNELPVSLAELKTYLKVTWDYEDDLLNMLNQSATNDIEGYSNRILVTRTFLGEYDAIEFSKFEVEGFVEIRRSPLGSITSIEVIQGGSGVAVTGTVEKDNFSYARVLFDDPLPSYDDDVARPLQIVFTAGYGAATDVPGEDKLAIMKLVNFHYRNRGDCAAQCEGPGTIFKSVKRIIGTFG
jgi:uncharacterized phiE125 gp8 family phage protein